MLIDWTRVSELKAEIGPEDFGDVVDLFLEEVDEGIDALRNDPDRQMLEAQLHFLKGSALNLGFSAFSGLCQSGERHAAAGRHGEVDLDALLTSYARSKAEFLGTIEAGGIG